MTSKSKDGISIILSPHPKAPSPKLNGLFLPILKSIPYEIIYSNSKAVPQYNKILLCGLDAARPYINTHEGYQFTGVLPGVKGEKAIRTFLPTYCPHVGFYHFMSNETPDKEDSEESKDHATTRPGNYLHWIKVHLSKLLSLGNDVDRFPEDVNYYPQLNEIETFLAHSRRTLYLDIENREADRSLHCIGLAYETGPILVIPIYCYNGQRAYDNIGRLWRCLAKALLDNTLVIHNCQHDLAILSYCYSLPFGHSIYDTMVAQHRIAPEAEKSLDHCIAQWTTLPYHKGDFIEPTSADTERQMWTYNARDVHAMRLIHAQQLDYAKRIEGLSASIRQANASIYAYRLNELHGIACDMDKLKVQRTKWAMICRQYLRILNLLVGYQINPASPDQVGNYLYTEMKYPIIERTDKGAPATGTRVLYRLLLTHHNPAITMIIKCREALKTETMLAFNSI